jgi:hypothetical protein
MALPIPSMSRLAKDIAEGFITLSPTMLRGTQVDILRTLNRELMKALQTTRGTAVALDNFKELKDKNTKITRLNHAMQVLKHFCAERKIIIG